MTHRKVLLIFVVSALILFFCTSCTTYKKTGCPRTEGYVGY